MADILDSNGITSLPMDPDRVLEKAKGKLTEVMVVGYDRDGQFYFAGSHSDGPNNVWLCEMAKRKLLKICDQD